MASTTYDPLDRPFTQQGQHGHGRGRGRGRSLPETGTGQTLADARTEQQVRITGITGGHCLRVRLAELGISVGSTVRILRSYGGPLIIAVKEDARMAIGRRMASQILIEKVD